MDGGVRRLVWMNGTADMDAREPVSLIDGARKWAVVSDYKLVIALAH